MFKTIRLLSKTSIPSYSSKALTFSKLSLSISNFVFKQTQKCFTFQNKISSFSPIEEKRRDREQNIGVNY